MSQGSIIRQTVELRLFAIKSNAASQGNGFQREQGCAHRKLRAICVQHVRGRNGFVAFSRSRNCDAGYDLTFYLNSRDFEDKKFYGYIAASNADPGNLVMAIRGTEELSEWLLDFSALPIPFTPVPDAGLVALGVLSIFDTFQIADKNGADRGLNDALVSINAATPIQSLTIIGHSLGAALATLTAAQVAIQNPAGVKNRLIIYTFASPRVGLLDLPPPSTRL
jgi:hypothetical protein